MGDAFRNFNETGSGYCTAQDLLDGLSRLGLKDVTAEEINLFMQRYDKDSDDKLQYSDFCQAFLP